MLWDKQAWTEADLLGLKENRIPEDTNIEYKSFQTLNFESNQRNRVIEEISKDFSAMANAAGGVIVYGIKEDSNYLPVEIETGFNPADAKHDWLEKILDTYIKPSIKKLRVFRVPLDTISPGFEALVVSVPPTLTGHQAKDGRYYQRKNTTTSILEDFQVRDLMSRPTHPVVEIETNYKILDQGSGVEHTYAFLLSLTNTGPVRIKDLRVEIVVPERMFSLEGQVHVNPNIYNIRVIDKEVETPEGVYYGAKNIIYQTEGKVIFPSQTIAILDEIEVSMMTGTSVYKPFLSYRINRQLLEWVSSRKISVMWTAYADDMPPQNGNIPLIELQDF